MNILFVNYGDFTANSLNHIAGFAAELSAAGHACAVAVPGNPASVSAIPEPRGFLPVVFEEALGRPALFPDGRPADLIHAWTPRENVRRFVLAYQRAARARLVVHLEDNEEFLLAAWFKRAPEAVRALAESELAENEVAALAHPRRYRLFLAAADAATLIVEPLARFVPAGVPRHILPPGVDFGRYHPAPPDPALRAQLGLRPEEKVVVFTGSVTFANEPEVRQLYEAVGLLHGRGFPTRLVQTGFGSPDFEASLPSELRQRVLNLGFVEKARLPGLLALADVLVQPGRPGPFNDYRLPSKLPEYLAMGKPVVLPASNVGLELRDGIEALVLPSADAEAMAAACARVFSDPALAESLGRNAAAFARARFDLKTNARGLAGLYARVAALPPRPGSTAAQAGEDTEVSLAVRAMAASLPDAGLAADLADLVAALERQERGLGERRRLEHERDEARRQNDLTRRHNAIIDSELRLAKDHIRNLERQTALARGQLQRVGDRLARSEASLAAARSRLSQLKEELRAQAESLGGKIAAREIKIAAMQASFSWRATQPLRFLRRKLIDPWRGPPPAPILPPPPPPAPSAPEAAEAEALSPGLAAVVDHPDGWNLPPQSTVVSGWCYALDGRELTSVRAVLGERIVAGSYGLPRPDVAASASHQPRAAASGWRIELELSEADTSIDLEAAGPDGRWLRFHRAALSIDEAFRQADPKAYEDWCLEYDHVSAEALGAQAAEASALPRQPLISVLMPVYNPAERWLRCAIDSVRAQTYPRWELCLADDASTASHVRPVIEEAMREDPRIKAVFREKNGHIAAASQSALALAQGDFIALMDHDDELAPHALFEVASAHNARPDADLFYSDEDKIDELGRRKEPYFKPDWMPDLFLGQNYPSHLSVYRASLVREAGGFRPGFEGSQDWDLALRVVERTAPEGIVHIPKVLYHWRAVAGSTALLLSEKSYPTESAAKALAEHLRRTGQRAELLPVKGGHWRVKHSLPDPAPLVTLVIPTRDGAAYLRRCVDSILEKTAYPRYEILIVDNGSSEPAALEYLASLAGGRHPLLRPGHAVRVLRDDRPFNFSALNNRAVREARGEIVGLLNNDLEVIDAGWLEEMASQALRPGIGCVGAMLYYPDDTIQHAGCVLGVGGVAGHAIKTVPRGTEGRFNRARLVQNYSAVTAACLLVRKSVYEQVGGLDEQALAVAFNDVDFCLKVRAAGYRNLWTPFAELYHHESVSRGGDDTPEKAGRFRSEVEAMLGRWGHLLTQDPAYNPNLTLEHEDFSLASPPRAAAPS